MALKRRQQIFLREETTEGTPFAALTDFVTATYGKYLALDPTIEFDPQRIERNIARGTLTPPLSISGQRLATMTFGLEITGSGTTHANTPQFDIPLRACGFRRELLQKSVIGAITIADKFIHGEQVALASAASIAIGTVVKDTYDGEPVLYIARQNGLATDTASTATGVAIVGMTSGATVTCTAPGFVAQSAYGYWPVSYPLTSLVVLGVDNALAVGDTIKGSTSLAVAVVDVAQAAVTPADTATTIFVRLISGHFTDGEAITRIAPTSAAIGLLDTGAEDQFTSPTISGALTKDGVWEAASNMRGNVTIRLPVGEIPTMQFELKGGYMDHADGSNISGISFPQLVPVPVLSAAFKIADNDAASTAAFVSPCVASIEIQTGNDLTQRQCMNSSSGVYAYEITSRAPSVTLDPELQPEAFFPVMQNFIDSQNVCMEVRVQPVANADRDGRTFIFQIPSANVSAASTTDRNGVLVRSLTLSPNSGSSTNASVTHDNDIIIIADVNVDATTGV